MLETLEEFMPKSFSWTKPEGGLFLMAKGPKGIDLNALLLDCIQNANVAYVAGDSFFCDGTGQNTCRLNFSYETEEKNREGCERLGKYLQTKV